jgi:hypothetical protein
MKYILFLLLFTGGASLLPAQDFPTEISVQYGPETGISGLMPKLGYRNGPEGSYWGISVSVWIVSVAGVTISPCYGYRHRGASAELATAVTFVPGKREGGTKEPRGYFLTANPKVLVGHRVYAGFGPGFYLYRSKKPTNTLWDAVGRYNFELGYSERLRF